MRTRNLSPSNCKMSSKNFTQQTAMLSSSQLYCMPWCQQHRVQSVNHSAPKIRAKYTNNYSSSFQLRCQFSVFTRWRRQPLNYISKWLRNMTKRLSRPVLDCESCDSAWLSWSRSDWLPSSSNGRSASSVTNKHTPIPADFSTHHVQPNAADVLCTASYTIA